MLADVRKVIAAANGFDDRAEDDKAGVAVAPMVARLEAQRLVDEQGEVVARRTQRLLHRLEARAEEVAQAGGVREQVMDRGAVRDRPGQVWEVAADRLVQRQRAPFVEL